MLIDVKGLRKTYGVKTVLDGVDLQVEEGEMLGLLGPNGAGKTTLIKVLCGLLVPNGGGGTVLGYDLLRQPSDVRSRVSLVAPTADVGTDNNLTVRQNLDFWAVVYGLRGRQRTDRVDAVLELVDLKEAQDAWPMHISAGMRQRLAIARALLAENKLLFLDEPTIKLDVEGARRIREFIRKVNQRSGVTILLTTHLMFEAEELCRRILVLDRGRIVAGGTPAELKQMVGRDGQIETVVEGLAPDRIRAAGYECDDSGTVRVTTRAIEAETARLLDRVAELGGRIRSLRTQEVTLEDVFFHLTGRGLEA
jgi:ABC-2 type transport system ATP-binding protein